MNSDIAILLVVVGLGVGTLLLLKVEDWLFERNNKEIDGVDFENFPLDTSFPEQIKWVQSQVKGGISHRGATTLIMKFYEKFPELDKVNI